MEGKLGEERAERASVPEPSSQQGAKIHTIRTDTGPTQPEKLTANLNRKYPLMRQDIWDIRIQLSGSNDRGISQNSRGGSSRLSRYRFALALAVFPGQAGSCFGCCLPVSSPSTPASDGSVNHRHRKDGWAVLI